MKKTLSIIILLSLVLTGCTNDFGQDIAPVASDSVAIEVNLDALGFTDLRSRAVSDDDNACLSDVNDLHFKITLNDGSDPIYFSLVSFEPGKISTTLSVDAEIMERLEPEKGEKVYIHFPNLKSNNVDKVEVIGNKSKDDALKGCNLTTDEGWKAALAAKLTQSTTIDQDEACPLYGFTDKVDGTGTHGLKCALFKVELKRPYAMVKVHVNTKGLNHDRIVITPQSVQLFNVPKTCTLGEENYIKDLSGRQREGMLSYFKESTGDGEFKYDAEQRLYMFENLGNNKAQKCKVSGDAYYTEDGDMIEWKKNPNKETPDIQYDKFNAEAYHAFESEINNPNNLGNFCSFIKVTAKYVLKDASGNEILSGIINYRLFLGEYISYGFNVERNKIYDVTLTLTGDGGVGEAGGDIDSPQINGGWKWRVDYNGGVYLWPNEIDLNSGTEMVTINLVDINKYLTDKLSEGKFKFVWGIFDTTNPDGPQPNIQIGYESTFLPKSYRFNDGMRPVFWTGDKWDQIGNGYDIIDKSKGEELIKGDTKEIDGDIHVFYPYTYIFSPFRQWELDEDEVEHPYREYTILFAVTDDNSSDNKLRFSYLNDVKQDERSNPSSSWDPNYPFVGTLTKNGEYIILAKAVVRQWNPIKVWDNAEDVGHPEKVAFYLDRKDRDLMPFGEDVSGSYNDDKNGFKASVGLYQANPSLAQKQMGENFMNASGNPNLVSAYAYGLYIGAYKYGTLYAGESQSKDSFFRRDLFDEVTNDYKARIWPTDGGLWKLSDSYPPNLSRDDIEFAFRGWCLPSDQEWGYLINGYYNSKLEGEVNAFLKGNYWSANYDNEKTAHVMSGRKIKKDGQRSDKLPGRFRNSFNAWRVDEEAGLGLDYSLFPGKFAANRDLYRLP